MSFEKELYDYSVSKMHLCVKNDEIPDELFRVHNVNRGLRDIHGKGVLTGLTRISEITAFKEEDGKRIPCDGQLWYRGYDIRNLVERYCKERFAFEKLTYLLIFGELPDDKEADGFITMLTKFRDLPTNFVRDVIMKAPSQDIMNSMTRSTLTLASYDPYAQNIDIPNAPVDTAQRDRIAGIFGDAEKLFFDCWHPQRDRALPETLSVGVEHVFAWSEVHPELAQPGEFFLERLFGIGPGFPCYLTLHFDVDGRARYREGMRTLLARAEAARAAQPCERLDRLASCIENVLKDIDAADAAMV